MNVNKKPIEKITVEKCRQKLAGREMRFFLLTTTGRWYNSVDTTIAVLAIEKFRDFAEMVLVQRILDGKINFDMRDVTCNVKEITEKKFLLLFERDKDVEIHRASIQDDGSDLRLDDDVSVFEVMR